MLTIHTARAAPADRRVLGASVTSTIDEQVLFRRDGPDRWIPDALARGAFDGVHGGAVGALLCAVAEDGCEPGLQTSAITVQLFRSAPLSALTTNRRLVHQGRRAAFCDVTLFDEERLLARAQVTFTNAVDAPRVPEQPDAPLDTSSLTPLPPYYSAHGAPWHDAAMEKAIDPHGVNWYRSDWSAVGEESSFARALPLVDWVSGISRPDDWQDPVVRGTPNVEFTMHADRPPEPGWIGMKTYASWRRRGVGFATAELWDARGPFGRFSTTIILLP